MTLRVPLSEAKYPFPRSFEVADPAPAPVGLHFYQRLLDGIRALPGVQAAGVSTRLPLGAGMGWGKYASVEGRPVPASLDAVASVQFALISPDYLRAMEIAVLRGRPFQTSDSENAQPVAIVNEAAVRELFGGADPLGKTIWLGPPEHLLPLLPSGQAIRFPRRTVVGVVANVKGASLSRPPGAEVYAPYTQSAREGWTNAFMVAVRSHVPVDGILPAIREQVRALDPEQPITDVLSMDQRRDRSLSRARFSTLMLGLFAGVALLLAAVGVYGVMSFTVAQRTREIGVHMALGARGRDVLWMVVRQGMTLTLAGVGLGLLGALALTRVLSKMLYGLTATDPGTYAGVPVVLVVVALLACLVPGLRATRVDPMVALRYE